MTPSSIPVYNKMPISVSIGRPHHSRYLKYLDKYFEYTEQEMHNFWFDENNRVVHFLARGFTSTDARTAAKSFVMYTYPGLQDHVKSAIFSPDYVKYRDMRMAENALVFSTEVSRPGWLAMIDSYTKESIIPPNPYYTTEYFQKCCFLPIDFKDIPPLTRYGLVLH